VVIAAACLAGAGCAGSAAPSDGSASREDTSITTSITTSSTTTRPWTDLSAAGAATLDIADADWLQVTDDHVWTTLGTPAGGTIQQLDAKSGAEQRSIFNRGADTCTAMDVGFGSLWAAVCDPTQGSVVRVDPSSGKVLARVPLKGKLIQEEGSVAAGEGFVWVVTAPPGRSLVQIDPRTTKVVRTLAVASGVVSVRAGLGGVWLANPLRGELLRLDPRTVEVVATIPVGLGPRFFAVGEGAVWVQNNLDGTVSRVDPTTNTVTATVTVNDGPIDGGDLAVGGGFVWARVSAWLVSKIDPATAEVVARYGPPAGSGSVAADETAVWISAHDIDVVYRLPLP
jgi:YVTN family beta-propeller protein